MLDDLRQLIHVQRVDTEIASVDAKLGALPGEKQAVEQAVVAARAALADARALLEKEELDERRLESEMREQEARAAKLESQSGQVLTSKAYDALQHEIANASSAGSDYETRALELMEAVDSARQAVGACEQEFAALEADAPVRLGSIGTRTSELEGERGTLLEKRAAESEGVAAALLKRYEQVAANRSPAIIVLSGEACPHCRMAIPPQRAIEIRRGAAAHHCDSCRRLLVPVEAMEG